MAKIMAVAILLAVVLVLIVAQTLQISDLKNRISASGLVTGKTSSSSSGSIDMTGWTENEKMNYEMHGVIPARLETGAAASAPRMVGGC
jgi:hypothetical protein